MGKALSIIMYSKVNESPLSNEPAGKRPMYYSRESNALICWVSAAGFMVPPKASSQLIGICLGQSCSPELQVSV
jgi:hypothetical protein